MDSSLLFQELGFPSPVEPEDDLLSPLKRSNTFYSPTETVNEFFAGDDQDYAQDQPDQADSSL